MESQKAIALPDEPVLVAAQALEVAARHLLTVLSDSAVAHAGRAVPEPATAALAAVTVPLQEILELARGTHRPHGAAEPTRYGEISIELLAENCVHSAVAEILDSRKMQSPEQLRAWLRDAVHDDTGFSASDDASTPPAPIEPDALLAALVADVDGPVALQGTASAMPISGLFTLLATSRKSGCLHFRRGAEQLRFVFHLGAIVATTAEPSRPDQRLGELLVQRGLLSTERRAALLTLAGERGVPLGAVAVQDGAVSVDDLRAVLRDQVQARFDRVFRDDELAYAFVPAPPPEDDGRIRVQARELLLETARRQDEANRR